MYPGASVSIAQLLIKLDGSVAGCSSKCIDDPLTHTRGTNIPGRPRILINVSRVWYIILIIIILEECNALWLTDLATPR